jgi:hypothetical protein
MIPPCRPPPPVWLLGCTVIILRSRKGSRRKEQLLGSRVEPVKEEKPKADLKDLKLKEWTDNKDGKITLTPKQKVKPKGVEVGQAVSTEEVTQQAPPPRHGKHWFRYREALWFHLAIYAYETGC